jgi:hypothetical protein
MNRVQLQVWCDGKRLDTLFYRRKKNNGDVVVIDKQRHRITDVSYRGNLGSAEVVRVKALRLSA